MQPIFFNRDKNGGNLHFSNVDL